MECSFVEDFDTNGLFCRRESKYHVVKLDIDTGSATKPFALPSLGLSDTRNARRKMEELYCAEVPACSEGPIALQDPVLLHDSRVLTNLLQLQPFTMPAQNYFKHIQSDIQPYMRKVVTRWMLDVSMSELLARFEFETVEGISVLVSNAFPLATKPRVALDSGEFTRKKSFECNYLSIIVSYLTCYYVTCNIMCFDKPF